MEPNRYEDNLLIQNKKGENGKRLFLILLLKKWIKSYENYDFLLFYQNNSSTFWPELRMTSTCLGISQLQPFVRHRRYLVYVICNCNDYPFFIHYVHCYYTYRCSAFSQNVTTQIQTNFTHVSSTTFNDLI